MTGENKTYQEKQSAVSVKDYFDTDYFSRDPVINKNMSADYAFGVNIKHEPSGTEWNVQIQQKLNFDYKANALYSYFYISELEPPIDLIHVCKSLVDTFVHNPFKVAPPALQYDIRFRNNAHDRFQSSKRLIDTRQMVIYIDADLTDSDKEQVYAFADSKGVYVRIRDRNYANLQSSLEKPLAFISHDSRDKDSIARPLAQELTKIVGRVWFDEYSLRVGDSLRESIWRGLRECKRCILILTPNFLSNTGWTKTEFNSIFTRELMERINVIIPVWSGVTVRQVYEYSPTLADRVAANWDQGCEAVSIKIREAILDQPLKLGP